MIPGDKRVVLMKNGDTVLHGPVVYWMGREQRVNDNWPLLFAQGLALEKKVPLVVTFCMSPRFLDASLRQYHFMIEGLKETAAGLKRKNIPFVFLTGEPPIEIPKIIKDIRASAVVTDFEPIKIKKEWKRRALKGLDVDTYEIDGRNIVPCHIASSKQEFGAYTIRPKIHRFLDEFAVEYPPLRTHPYGYKGRISGLPLSDALRHIRCDRNVRPVNWLIPGESAALATMKSFIRRKLAAYHKDKNDPSKDALSNLSPYLHFGHISSLTVYHAVKGSNAPLEAKRAFLEELVVRRELSDNFCHYNDNYDSFDGLPEWAKKTLNAHRKDRREHLYTLKELEAAKTHDPLWNAAQREMVENGKMHGYLRMYWGKKILEWTASPEDAIKFAVYLNDRYELDGRDTNGYAGILWSIGGLHDRAWNEREVFGKIRYMSYNSQLKKAGIRERVKNAMLS